MCQGEEKKESRLLSAIPPFVSRHARDRSVHTLLVFQDLTQKFFTRTRKLVGSRVLILYSGESWVGYVWARTAAADTHFQVPLQSHVVSSGNVTPTCKIGQCFRMPLMLIDMPAKMNMFGIFVSCNENINVNRGNITLCEYFEPEVLTVFNRKM